MKWILIRKEVRTTGMPENNLIYCEFDADDKEAAERFKKKLEAAYEIPQSSIAAHPAELKLA